MEDRERTASSESNVEQRRAGLDTGEASARSDVESVAPVTLLHQRALRLLREGNENDRALAITAAAVELYVAEITGAAEKNDRERAARASASCRQLLEAYGEGVLVLARRHRDTARSLLRWDIAGAEREFEQALLYYDEARLVPPFDKIAASESVDLVYSVAAVVRSGPSAVKQKPPRRPVHNIAEVKIYREHTQRTFHGYCRTCAAYMDELFHFPCTNIGPLDLCARCKNELEARCLPAIDAWWRTMAHNGTTPRR